MTRLKRIETARLYFEWMWVAPAWTGTLQNFCQDLDGRSHFSVTNERRNALKVASVAVDRWGKRNYISRLPSHYARSSPRGAPPRTAVGIKWPASALLSCTLCHSTVITVSASTSTSRNGIDVRIVSMRRDSRPSGSRPSTQELSFHAHPLPERCVFQEPSRRLRVHVETLSSTRGEHCSRESSRQRL